MRIWGTPLRPENEEPSSEAKGSSCRVVYESRRNVLKTMVSYPSCFIKTSCQIRDVEGMILSGLFDGCFRTEVAVPERCMHEDNRAVAS